MTTPSSPPIRSSRPWLVLLAGALLGALALLLVGPRPLTIGAPTGDPALAAEVTAAMLLSSVPAAELIASFSREKSPLC